MWPLRRSLGGCKWGNNQSGSRWKLWGLRRVLFETMSPKRTWNWRMLILIYFLPCFLSTSSIQITVLLKCRKFICSNWAGSFAFFWKTTKKLILNSVKVNSLASKTAEFIAADPLTIELQLVKTGPFFSKRRFLDLHVFLEWIITYKASKVVYKL